MTAGRAPEDTAQQYLHAVRREITAVHSEAVWPRVELVKALAADVINVDTSATF